MPDSSHTSRMSSVSPPQGTPGTLTLIGAAELMPAMSSLHRDAISNVKGPVRAVFVDTTAGFETNIGAITAKAVEYYAQRLQTELHVASFRHAQGATEAEVARAIAEIRAANFIFAGPGSPTYALHHWRGSAVWDAMVGAFRRGASLLFASAATITLGRYSLPVYEIFKAGRDPYWEDGLDLLGDYGLKLAIIPHYNDNSGGEHYDSRFCYMGATRFDKLQAQLPPDVAILGIDEYTAIRFDLAQRTGVVVGQGVATLIADGQKTVLTSGSVFGFDDLHSTTRVVVSNQDPEPKTYGYEFAESPTEGTPLEGIAEYVASLPTLDAGARIELLARIEAAAKQAAAAQPSTEGPLVELVLGLRTALRAEKQWGLADRCRDALVELGYEIQDTRDGTTWRPR